MLLFSIDVIDKDLFSRGILTNVMNNFLSDVIIQIRNPVFCGPYNMDLDSDI